MKAKFIAAAIAACFFTIKVSAQEIPSDSISGVQIILRKENNLGGSSHLSHRVPARREVVPSVYYDSRALTLSSSVSMNITYNVCDEDGVMVCQGTVNLLEEQDTTIPIPAGVEGECTITLVINDQAYWGAFYVN